MKAEAVPLGDRLIAQEAELDKQFASKTITLASLAAATEAIGTTHATLRRTHLKYHLFTVEVLTPAQVQRYAELRGYKTGLEHPHGRPMMARGRLASRRFKPATPRLTWELPPRSSVCHRTAIG
jgi:hypothetical protein